MTISQSVEASLATLAREVGQLRHDLAALGGIVAALEKRLGKAATASSGSAQRLPSVNPPPSSEATERAAWIASLPCLRCEHPSGADVRHPIGQDQLSMNQRTPSGLPLMCCRVRHVGVRAA